MFDTTDGMSGMSGYISQQAFSSSLLPLLFEHLIDLLVHHVFGQPTTPTKIIYISDIIIMGPRGWVATGYHKDS